MRILGVIIVGCALSIVLSVWLDHVARSRQATGVLFPSLQVQITGPGNTLASVAQQVNDPTKLSYDPKTRMAVSHATLVIQGELQLGRPGEPGAGELLQLATEVCGDLRLEVRPSGVLRLYHSTISTVSEVLSAGACSRGYALFVDGELIMEDSRISYISGSTSECLRRQARATIRRSVFSYCDGSALSCVQVDGSRITIEDCDIRGSGNWGLVVVGPGGAPVEVRNSTLDARLGAVFVTGESGKVRLVDCHFDPSKIMFNGPSGQVEVAWTRRFQVVRGQAGPRAGLLVRAESRADGVEASSVEARTDERGMAVLVLTEWVSRPQAPARTGGTDRGRPYHVTVLGAQGNVLAELERVLVHGKDDRPVVVSVP